MLNNYSRLYPPPPPPPPPPPSPPPVQPSGHYSFLAFPPPPYVHAQYSSLNYYPTPGSPPQLCPESHIGVGYDRNMTSYQRTEYYSRPNSSGSALQHLPPSTYVPVPNCMPPRSAEYTSYTHQNTFQSGLQGQHFPSPPPVPSSSPSAYKLSPSCPSTSNSRNQAYVYTPLPTSSPMPPQPQYSTTYPPSTTMKQFPSTNSLTAALANAYPDQNQSSRQHLQSINVKPERIDSSQLPFPPVQLSQQKLPEISKGGHEQPEVGKPHAVKLMEANGFIDPNLPMELKQMFEPLYCKLCTLTLTSNIVARDHYIGKKHKKKIDQWLHDQRIFLDTNGPSGANAVPIASKGKIPGSVTKFKKTDVSTLNESNAGIFRKQIYQKQSEAIKRCFSKVGEVSDTEPAKKVPKKSTGGANFGFCDVCQLTLTSQAHADQHLNGKNHMAKLKKYDNWSDRTFGIGKAYRQTKD